MDKEIKIDLYDKYLVTFTKEGETNTCPVFEKSFEISKEDFERIFMLFEYSKRGEIKIA